MIENQITAAAWYHTIIKNNVAIAIKIIQIVTEKDRMANNTMKMETLFPESFYPMILWSTI